MAQLQTFWKNTLKKKNAATYDPAIILLNIFPEKLKLIFPQLPVHEGSELS